MNKFNLYQNESGMAAIVITTVLMLVITITTLGFAQTVRREQRNALDHQLASQAYYAAESGINLAENKMKAIVKAGGTVPNKTECQVPGGGNTGSYGGQAINLSEFTINSNSEITCLLITSELPNEVFQNIDQHATAALLKAKTGTMDKVEVSWQASSGSADLTNCGGLTQPPQTGTTASDWRCAQPLIRIDLVPLAGAMNALNRDTLKAAQYTAFLYPGSSAGTDTYSAGAVSRQILASCSAGNTPHICKATITGLSSSAYGVRFMSVYGRADVMLTPTSGGSAVTLIDGQVMVDVTARSADILRRVQVRTPVSGSGSSPDFELTSGGAGICKRYVVSAGIASWVAGTDGCASLPTAP